MRHQPTALAEVNAMGNCIPRGRGAGVGRRRETAIVIHHEGRVLEYGQPMMVGSVVSGQPGCFLCCAESMNVDSQAVRMGEREVLRPGHMYFLLPLSRLPYRLSLSDLCDLAVRASSALVGCDRTFPPVPVVKVGSGEFVPILESIDEAF